MLVGGIGGQGGFKWHKLAHHQLLSQPRTHFSPPVQLKLIIKEHFSGRMVSNGINNVAFASVLSEKTHLKKLIMIVNEKRRCRVI